MARSIGDGQAKTMGPDISRLKGVSVTIVLKVEYMLHSCSHLLPFAKVALVAILQPAEFFPNKWF